MATAYDIQDLETWDAKIREKVQELGLSCFPQEFEVCNHNQMLGYMAYSGMPSHYPHWSYGKAYEKLKTHGSFSACAFIAFRLAVATASLCPPERKKIPGTAAGTVRLRQASVASAIRSGAA